MTRVKICGVMTPEDAALAAEAGADYVGIILWPKGKRAVGVEQARFIAVAARSGGAQPVAVFVDEGAEEIRAIAQQTGIEAVQLHGPAAREAWSELEGLERFLSVEVERDGSCDIPDVETEWLHFDRPKGGDGQPFDWSRFTPPRQQWMLAGGLTPENVSRAVAILRPTAVDVAGGVCKPDGLSKDSAKVRAFIQAAKGREHVRET